MTENDVNPPINNDPMEKRNEFIDHPSYKSRLITEMKQDEYSTANQLWNAGTTEVQELNPGGPDQRQIIRPSQLNLKLRTTNRAPLGKTMKAFNAVQANSSYL